MPSELPIFTFLSPKIRHVINGRRGLIRAIFVWELRGQLAFAALIGARGPPIPYRGERNSAISTNAPILLGVLSSVGKKLDFRSSHVGVILYLVSVYRKLGFACISPRQN